MHENDVFGLSKWRRVTIANAQALCPSRRAAQFLGAKISILEAVLREQHAGRNGYGVDRLRQRHDLVAVTLRDPREEELPRVGLVQMEDAETGEQFLLDTSSAAVRRAYAERAAARRTAIRQLARAAQVDLIEVATDGRHLEALLRFFKLRERRLKRT